ncbi:C4b-binding protein alpha chain isoform X1 [Ictalurus punctatus]|uniref:C4b-binding protein alpha chain isoform X1 n=1 Tax=Ictalurus punctatus TaxID=7998 RepID=A0A9F7RH41_ICTPU|nr:C4b-binding protein alpha chain isoform X1 [Ictalurus punctatus]XP_053542105.1 C4b-binding protein alpha chain isoform X1 [Ictalurus punctatus]XP_053542106.1 C4b-binding protein alpha chain isoform X1 [Ictalurus punctatus]XP_053542107.1 C4b-binding protein alpha chain isoform X1 [Ictalurus punctatus]XP_053542108.1 C4b-binding protein alpha chain isoform X1 [Ictalurus punctatus]XP_053542109.1 C4b-binding protein alpha chain isoform X1 [Ictalurus punctatus]XP_053542110.1 C4b-binding protein 
MMETPSYSLIILLMCLMKVGEIQAQCMRPSVGGNRVLTEESGQDTFPDGATATFKCATGYRTVSGSPKITCKGQQWTDLELQCTKKSCGSLPDVTNGRYLTPDGIEYGATATVQCEKGFMNTVASNTRNCREDGWDGRDAVCEVVKCLKPLAILNGMFDPEEDSYDYTQAVTYSCNKDYTLIGSEVISCIENGTFHPSPPQCLLIKCDAPKVDNAVRIEGKSPPYSYNNFLRYKCKEGYRMEGSAYLKCDVNGWNPPPPVCIDATSNPTSDTNLDRGADSTLAPPLNNHNRNIGIGIGVVAAILVIGGGVLYFLKKRTGWGKVPSRHEGGA